MAALGLAPLLSSLGSGLVKVFPTTERAAHEHEEEEAVLSNVARLDTMVTVVGVPLLHRSEALRWPLLALCSRRLRHA